MNNYFRQINSDFKYSRRKDRRRKKYLIRAAIVLLTALVCAAIFGVLGNSLLDRAELLRQNAAADDPSYAPGADFYASSGLSESSGIKAGFLNMQSAASDYSAINAALLELAVGTGGVSYNAVSVILRDGGGSLCFNTDITAPLPLSAVLGFPGDNTGDAAGDNYAASGAAPPFTPSGIALDFSELRGAADAAGLYISGCFYTAAFGQPGIPYGQIISYESALAGELSDNGAGDILIFGLPFGLDNTDANRLDEITVYLQQLRLCVTGTPVGAVIPLNALREPDAPLYLKRLAFAADFIAVDFSEINLIQSGSIAETLREALESCGDYIEKYGVRILLSRFDVVDFEEIIGILNEYNIAGWQFIS